MGLLARVLEVTNGEGMPVVMEATGGKVAFIRGNASFTRLIISSVDALALFKTVSSAERTR